MEEIELIREFVIESTENLERLDAEMVELERHPDNSDLLASVFRTIHTIKGTCGFLNFAALGGITHHAEAILCQIRNGERKLTADIVSLILATVDAVRFELVSIETTSKESGQTWDDLISRQQRAASLSSAPAARNEQDADLQPSDKADDSVRAAAADSTIRVDVAQLNKLMNLVGELVLARNQILQFNSSHDDPVFNATSQRLNLITTELQEGVMRTRMQPIGVVWSKLPRVVRDLAVSCGKQIRLEMKGSTTELDKTIIEAIKDPLTHIVRNACDHGVESPEARVAAGKRPQGTLSLHAYHEGGYVNIEIADDGAGMDRRAIRASAVSKGLVTEEQSGRLSDRELLNLAFLPGLSTAHVVSNVSGRGVGMDVVRANVEKIGGTVDLASTFGQGTTLKIKIPLTLAIIPGLVITAAGERFIIPQVSLLELVRLEGPEITRQIERINGTPVYRRRGTLLPLAYLNRILQMEEPDSAASDVVNIVVLQAEDRHFGLIVDGVNDTQEIVVKALGNQLKGLQCYAGATIMGDGRISLILDVAGVARLSGVLGESHRTDYAAATSAAAETAASTRRNLLLFAAGSFTRLAVPLSLVARLEEIPRSRIEQASGTLAVQYRGDILPLADLSAQLGGGANQSLNDPVFVMVFADGDRRIGLIVDRIIDIVEENLSATQPSVHPCLLGSGVVGGQVTDFLDLHAAIRAFDQSWFERRAHSREATVLVAEDSLFSRGLMRSYLEIAGHKVLEASSPREALDRLGKNSVDVVVASLDLPDRGAFELLDSIRRQSGLSRVPVVALSAQPGEVPGRTGCNAFSECLSRFDRLAMLRSLDRLAAATAPTQLVPAAELIEVTR